MAGHCRRGSNLSNAVPHPAPNHRLVTIAWNVYKIAAKLTWVGITVAPDEPSAIEAAAKEFGQPADRLIADGAVK